VKPKHLFIVTAVIEAATGVALLLSPPLPVSLLLGASLDTPGGLVSGRVAGAALLSLRAHLVPGPGELWTLLGASLYGLQVVALARVARRTDPLALATAQSAVVMLLLLPWAPAAWRRRRRLGREGAWSSP